MTENSARLALYSYQAVVDLYLGKGWPAWLLGSRSSGLLGLIPDPWAGFQNVGPPWGPTVYTMGVLESSVGNYTFGILPWVWVEGDAIRLAWGFYSKGCLCPDSISAPPRIQDKATVRVTRGLSRPHFGIWSSVEHCRFGEC